MGIFGKVDISRLHTSLVVEWNRSIYGRNPAQKLRWNFLPHPANAQDLIEILQLHPVGLCNSLSRLQAATWLAARCAIRFRELEDLPRPNRLLNINILLPCLDPAFRASDPGGSGAASTACIRFTSGISAGESLELLRGEEEDRRRTSRGWNYRYSARLSAKYPSR
jgi:hypothetical protein